MKTAAERQAIVDRLDDLWKSFLEWNTYWLAVKAQPKEQQVYCEKDKAWSYKEGFWRQWTNEIADALHNGDIQIVAAKEPEAHDQS